MAFFTSLQLFGNGAGTPGSPGWVPIDTAAPPTFSANNRGVAFGEQLSSAIANRPHYALALNDDNLNTRIALFETGGLNAAYDLGALAVDGGGRTITKTGGAVETISALAVQYGDDRANGHLRTNMIGDVIRGGGGLDVVSYGRGIGALYGVMDRRALNFAGYSVITDTVAATTSAPTTVMLGAGQFEDGSGNTHVLQDHDLLEILSGAHAGLYVIATIPTSTTCTLRNLDGTAPTFGATSPNVRLFRPVFGSFGIHGHSGTHSLSTTLATGTPGQESALDLVPGSTLGRYDTASASPDGARYALRTRWKAAGGAISNALTVDSQGQVQSYVNNAQLTATQRAAGANFGAPAFVVQQDEVTADYEVGFMARSNGAVEQWMGVLTVGDARTTATPTGVFAFNFIAVGAYNIDITDALAADNHVSPLVTFIEIITPSPQAGVYKVHTREINTGRVELRDLEGTAVSLPGAGAGTLRVLVTSSLGGRDVGMEVAAFAGTSLTTRAGAVIQAPKQDNSTALFLEAGGPSGLADFWAIRAVTAVDGISEEIFSVNGDGVVSGQSYEARVAEYAYKTARGKSIPVNIFSFVGGLSPILGGANPASVYSIEVGSNTSILIYDLDKYLRSNMTITDFVVTVNPGAARASGSNINVKLVKVDVNFGVATVPTPSVIATAEDDTTTNLQLISPTAFSESVVRNGAAGCSYYLVIQFGNTAATFSDFLYGIQLSVNDGGPLSI